MIALTLTHTTHPAATLFLVLFFFIAAFALPPSKFELKAGTTTTFKWPPYFQLPVIQLMLLVVLNDLGECWGKRREREKWVQQNDPAS